MSADPKVEYLKCEECGEFLEEEEIENLEDGAELCDHCDAELSRAEAEDRRLDDPRRGQAASLNSRYGR